MTWWLQLRLAIAVIGLVVWGYGYASDQSFTRLVGIGVLALSLLLRFVPDRKLERRSKDRDAT